MMRSRHISVSIDLDRVRDSAEQIRAATGVRLISVIKSDAYGLGAARVADAIASVSDDFAYFSIHEAREVARPGIVLGPPEGDPAHYRELELRPTVSNLADAERFRGLRVAVNVDTGMQRFGCPAGMLDQVLRRSGADEAFTHAGDPQSAERLRELCGARVGLLHAAASSLLDYPEARLDAVRPGIALYRGAARITTRLTLVRETKGRVGYSGFQCRRVGVILAGYSNHLRPGPVLINARRQWMLETGMNTTFVSVHREDREGDEVVLLGDGISEAELGRLYNCREHEILCRYASMGQRSYVRSDAPTPKPTGAAATESVLRSKD